MFQLSLFTEFGRLCNPFDYVLGFTFLLIKLYPAEWTLIV